MFVQKQQCKISHKTMINWKKIRTQFLQSKSFLWYTGMFNDTLFYQSTSDKFIIK